MGTIFWQKIFAKKKTVRALDSSPSRSLDHIFNASTGQYYIPYNPTKSLSTDLVKGTVADAAPEQGGLTAILDTGVLSHHPLLRNRIIESIDFTGEGSEDLNGHGTIVALIIATSGMPVDMLNVKVLDKDKEGIEEDLIQGMRWAADHNAKVLNLSLGIRRKCDGTCAVCEEAKRVSNEADVWIVAACGNDPLAKSCPVNSGIVFSMGALDYTSTRLADYSPSDANFYASGSITMIPLVNHQEYAIPSCSRCGSSFPQKQAMELRKLGVEVQVICPLCAAVLFIDFRTGRVTDTKQTFS